MCAARRLPVVYLSRTESWIQDAQRDNGDAFLLSALWIQNADLIAASEPLRSVFAGALRDDAGALTHQVMSELRRAVQRHRLGMGVIIDEVQHITAAVIRSGTSNSSTPAFTAGSYFRHNWHDWMSDNDVFARMSIASEHGERDYRLPSGEEHRVRVVEPLSDGQRDALQSHPASPAYVRDADVRQRIVFYSGNILRALMIAGHALPTNSRSALNAEVSRRLGKISAAMLENCRLWLESIAQIERPALAEQSKYLLAGKLPWTAAKGLYDAGIMYRSASSDFLRPVSAWASSAYLSCLAKHYLREARPLSSITDGRRRGFELEQQFLAAVMDTNAEVDTKLLDGTKSREIRLQSFYALPFNSLDELMPREVPVLYCPLSLTFRCDGILMPAASDTDGAIIIVECSTTNPRGSARVDKVLRYLEPTGVAGTLARGFPALRRIVALVYDGDLLKGELSSEKAVSLSRGKHPATAVNPGGAAQAAVQAAALSHGIDGVARPAETEVRVLDRSSLMSLRAMKL
jgi:hypothetical protein